MGEILSGMSKSKNKEKNLRKKSKHRSYKMEVYRESPDKFGWPNYGRILNEKSKNKKKRI